MPSPDRGPPALDTTDTVVEVARTVTATGIGPVTAVTAPMAVRMIGRYHVEGVLGQGGMGVVYAAHDPTLGRPVALKVIGALAATAHASARLVREAQSIARVSHPNVIQVFDAGKDDGIVYIAMERVDGTTLDRWLTAASRTTREILEVFTAAGRGLAAAHAAGLIHRDFKPENIMVARDGRVRVLDFGLARAAERSRDSADGSAGGGRSLPAIAGDPDAATNEDLTSDERRLEAGISPEIALTATGALVGTPRYMSPEQWRRDETDARSDQFSFCVALYSALAGHHPFELGPHGVLRDAVVEGRVKPFPPSVPAQVRPILRRGLAPRPDARFPSMEALLAAMTARSRRTWLGRGAAASVVAAIAVAGVAFGRHESHDLAALGIDAPIAPSDRPTAIYRSSRRITWGDDVAVAALSPDGRQVALLTRDAVVVQPMTADGAQRVVLRGRIGHEAVAWSPDGTALALNAAVDSDPAGHRTQVAADTIDHEDPVRLIRVDVATGAIRAMTESRHAFALVARDEIAAARFGDRELTFYTDGDPDRPRRTCAMPGTFSGIRAVRYHAGTDALFVQLDHGDRMSSIVRVDRACTRIETAVLPSPVRSFALRTSDAHVFVVDDGGNLVEIGDDGRPRPGRGLVQAEEYEPIGIGDDGSVVHLNRGRDWQLLAALPGGERRELARGAGESVLAISPDGETIAHIDGVLEEGLLRLRSLGDLGARTAPIARHATRAAWSSDGTRLAVLFQRDGGGYEVSTYRWTTGAWSPRREVNLRYVAPMVWMDDRRVAFACWEWDGFRWLDPDSGESGEILAGAGYQTDGLARAHRGATLAFVTGDRHELRVWTWTPGHAPAPIATIAVPGHGSRLPGITWSHDDASLILHDIETGAMWSVRARDGRVARLAELGLPRSGFTYLWDVFPLSDRWLLQTMRWRGDLYVSAPESP